MNVLRWHLRHWAGALGWQGIAGLCLIIAALALYFGGIERDRARIAQLQQEAQSIRAFSRNKADTSRTAPGYDAWLDRFYQLLPAKASAPDWLRIIFSAARGQSLGLDQGAYKVTMDKNGRLLAYEIGLPVHGTYTQIRAFVGDVLEKIPAIALDEIILKRESISDPRVDASIRFTLFLNAF